MVTESVPTPMTDAEKRDHLAQLERALLEAGGVDNWDWYSDALEESGFDPAKDDDADWLNALEAGGVDNWAWYGESLGEFFDYSEYVTEFTGTFEELKSYHQWLEDFEARQKAEAERARLKREEAEAEAKAKQEADAKANPDGSVVALREALGRFVDEDGIDELLAKVVEAGFWTRNRGFDKIMTKSLGNSRNLEGARKLYVDEVTKAKKGEMFRQWISPLLDEVAVLESKIHDLADRASTLDKKLLVKEAKAAGLSVRTTDSVAGAILVELKDIERTAVSVLVVYSVADTSKPQSTLKLGEKSSPVVDDLQGQLSEDWENV